MGDDAVDALTSGQAFVDLSGWRKVAVSGADALEWLNDLVSADVSDLGPGRARRSLLLSPTGRIRAEFTVTVPGGNLVLIQDPIQRERLEELLAPYVLSSDVELEERTDALAVFAFPGRSTPPDLPGAASSAPSVAGAGVDLLAPDGDRDVLLASLSRAYTLVDPEDLEAWRIANGIPRFGLDALDEDLPQEAGLDEAVAFDKGCYLGQEAVAKVRNLGHPRRVVLHLAAEDDVEAGEGVHVDGERVGEVTSAAPSDGHCWVLARVGWDGRAGPFQTAAGTPLAMVPPDRP